jgi:hypothetical protein
MAAVIDLTVMSHFSYFETPIPSGTIIDLTDVDLTDVELTDDGVMEKLTEGLGNKCGNKRTCPAETLLPAKKKSRLDAFWGISSDCEDIDASSDESEELGRSKDDDEENQSELEDEDESTVVEDE